MFSIYLEYILKSIIQIDPDIAMKPNTVLKIFLLVVGSQFDDGSRIGVEPAHKLFLSAGQPKLSGNFIFI